MSAPWTKPDAPRRAPGVALAGRMRESAYVEPPWLIERIGAGYARVPELLYRVLEQCDGRQSVEEIASCVSRSTGRRLAGADVQRLLDHRLVPSGLVVVGEASSAAVSPRSARSPLALSLRMKMVEPRRVEPIIRRLLWLYEWPLVLTVLALAGLAETWLYLVHGVSHSVRETLDDPRLLLVTWLVMLASAAFHELGHATALSYGGGRLKGMGLGWYLVYPAFYTDVSDNYRLPRWARVRTDLGGVYFNLIFALGLFGLYVVSRQEFLLLIVTLITLEIVHQLVPFVRLDGYWTLADLTGVPDFFTVLVETTRARLSGDGCQRQLPRLKAWAMLVFGSYVLVTVPLLTLVLGLLVASLPRVAAAAGESVLNALGRLIGSWTIGDAWGVAGAALEATVLALPVVGLGSMLASLGRMLFRSVWRWGGGYPSAARWALRAAACGAAGMVLAAVWLSQVRSLLDEAEPPAAVALPPIAEAAARIGAPPATSVQVQPVVVPTVTTAPLVPLPAPAVAAEAIQVPRPGRRVPMPPAASDDLASPAAGRKGPTPEAHPGPPRATPPPVARPRGGTPAPPQYGGSSVTRSVTGSVIAVSQFSPSVTGSVTRSVISASQSAAPDDPRPARRHTTASSAPVTTAAPARTSHPARPAGTPAASPLAVGRVSAAPGGATKAATAAHATAAHPTARHATATQGGATDAATFQAPSSQTAQTQTATPGRRSPSRP